MGAAGALELAGNLPSFTDDTIHGCHGIGQLDAKCALPGLTIESLKKPCSLILNNSFGMLGINSSLIIKKFVS